MVHHLFISIAGIFLVASVWCQTAGPTETDVLNEVRRATGNDISSIDSLSDLPPAKAWHGYRTIKGFFEFSHPELFKKAGRAIAKNREVQVLVEEKFKPVQKEFQREEGELLLLGGIPAGWSARILGRYLMDPTPMDPNEGDSDVRKLPNQAAAGWALSAMGFSDAPTQGAMPHLPEEKLEEWRHWWRVNESRIDERIREINPDYNPIPSSPGETASVPNMAPAVAAQQDTATASAPSPANASQLKDSDLLTLYLGGGLILLLLAGIGVQLLRKPK